MSALPRRDDGTLPVEVRSGTPEGQEGSGPPGRKFLPDHDDRAKAPRWVVKGDDKKKARLDCFHHLLSLAYENIEHSPIELPERGRHNDYSRSPVPAEIVAPEVY